MQVKTLTQMLILVTLVLPFAAGAGVGAFDKKAPPRFGFYAGAGLGAYNINPTSGDSSNGGHYGILLGVEEKNWALEVNLFQLRTSEDVADKTSDMMSSLSLAFRQPVSYSSYFKLKGGWLNYKDDVIDNSELVGGLGYGWMLESGNRLELEYEYTYQDVGDSVSKVDFVLHMISLQYIFGGLPEVRY